MKKTCLLVTFLFFCGVIFTLTACQPQASSLETVEVVEEFPSDIDFQAFTVSQISDYPLYEFHYPGDYGFDEYLRTGTSAWEPEIRISSPYACTCYAALGENNKIFGRNLDFYNHPALILFTDPPDGYSSVSMVDLYYLGYTFKLTPLDDKEALINSPYIPFDGMNENGLAAGMMAVHNAEGNSDPTKVTLAELEIIRLVLDYARDVPEAVDLIQQYNVIFEEVPIHYMFADALGNSVVVEYLNGNIITIENDQPWQVSTNFIISEEMPVGSNSSCWRFNSVYDALQSTEGRITPFEGMNLLEEVSQPGEFATRWSVVYDLMEKSILLAVGRNYEEIFSFSLTNQE